MVPQSIWSTDVHCRIGSNGPLEYVQYIYPLSDRSPWSLRVRFNSCPFSCPFSGVCEEKKWDRQTTEMVNDDRYDEMVKVVMIEWIVSIKPYTTYNIQKILSCDKQVYNSGTNHHTTISFQKSVTTILYYHYILLLYNKTVLQKYIKLMMMNIYRRETDSFLLTSRATSMSGYDKAAEEPGRKALQRADEASLEQNIEL